MPDLLSHAFIGLTIGIVISWRYTWLTRQYLTVCMVGAIMPDLGKIRLFLPFEMSNILGFPFSWSAFTTVGGIVVLCLLGGFLVVPSERRRVIGLLAVGSSSHLFADGLLRTSTGYSGVSFLWPITAYRTPTPGLYLSTDWWLAIVFGGISILVYLSDRYMIKDHR